MATFPHAPPVATGHALALAHLRWGQLLFWGNCLPNCPCHDLEPTTAARACPLREVPTTSRNPGPHLAMQPSGGPGPRPMNPVPIPKQQPSGTSSKKPPAPSVKVSRCEFCHSHAASLPAKQSLG